MSVNFDHLVQCDPDFKKYLLKNPAFTTDENAGKLFARVLHTLRDSLSPEESAQLMTSLPESLRMIYVSNWEPEAPKKEFGHLDEFVQEVLKKDKEAEEMVLNSELSALSATLVVLRMLETYGQIMSQPWLSHPMKREISSAMLSIA